MGFWEDQAKFWQDTFNNAKDPKVKIQTARNGNVGSFDEVARQGLDRQDQQYGGGKGRGVVPKQTQPGNGRYPAIDGMFDTVSGAVDSIVKDARRRGERGSRGQAMPNPLSFSDALKQAQEFFASSGMGASGPDYGALEANFRNQASTRDAQLEAMYGALERGIQGDAGAIGQNYDQALSGYNANADQASANITQGADSARNAQTEQLRALGIEEAAVNNALKEGGGAAGDQAAAIANVEQDRTANVNQGQTNKTAALNYNTGLARAAGLEGANQRGALGEALASRLAELSLQRSQSQAQSQQQNQSLIMQLAGNFQNDDNNAFDRASQLAQMQADQAQNQQKPAGFQGQDFISQAGSIASQLMTTYPTLSENEALQRAYQLLSGSQ